MRMCHILYMRKKSWAFLAPDLWYKWLKSFIMSVAGVSFNSNSLITYIFQLFSHTDTLCSLWIVSALTPSLLWILLCCYHTWHFKRLIVPAMIVVLFCLFAYCYSMGPPWVFMKGSGLSYLPVNPFQKVERIAVNNEWCKNSLQPKVTKPMGGGGFPSLQLLPKRLWNKPFSLAA